jgi:hypothetical protein
MSSIKNEIKTKVISDNNGKSIHQFEFQGNPIENEERKEQDLSKSNTNNEVSKKINSKTIQKFIRKRKKQMLFKKRIFKIIKKRRHNTFSKDNNKTIIIKHFVNFFLNFINLAINEILRINNINKKIDFKINFVIKSYISIDFITSKTVEDLLKFKLKQNQKNQINNTEQIDMHMKRNEKKYNINIEKSIKENVKQIKNLKKIENVNSQLDNLFKTKIIKIFKDLYVENKKEKIDLSVYGIDKIKLDLDKKFQTFEIIRNKYKDNEKKLGIFDNLIKNKFIEKPKVFTIKKKK